MSRILHLTIRSAAAPAAVGALVATAAIQAGVELLELAGSPLRSTVALGVDDDRPDELLAIDFAVALRADATDLGLPAVSVRLADTGSHPDADRARPDR